MFCSSRWVAKLCRKVCSETRLLISGHLGSGVTGAIELARGHRLDRIAAGKQPALRAAPPATRCAADRAGCGESMTLRSLPPLPCSTRMIIRLLSMSETLSETTSVARRPAP